MSDAPGPRVLCVSGPAGSGKTTLLRRLLPLLPVPAGEIGVVKSTHHRIDWHPDGTDSAALWSSGPAALCVAGPDQAAVFVRRDDRGAGGATRRLAAACRRLPAGLRLVLAEGFRRARAPTIWTADGPPGDEPPGPGVRAVVAPETAREPWERARPELAVHGRDEVDELAGRVMAWAAPLAELEAAPDGG